MTIDRGGGHDELVQEDAWLFDIVAIGSRPCGTRNLGANWRAPRGAEFESRVSLAIARSLASFARQSARYGPVSVNEGV
jgi:hypothetical protein